MKYVLNPEDYNFNSSALYPELDNFFGPNAFVKTIASDEKRGHYWYKAIKINDSLGEIRYEIYGGVFTKGIIITEIKWPKTEYFGLITNQTFAEDLLKHLMGTLRADSVETIGRDRLNMKCLYFELRSA
jgi:hypothetical protein